LRASAAGARRRCGHDRRTHLAADGVVVGFQLRTMETTTIVHSRAFTTAIALSPKTVKA
jgi:hypothetical protein